MHTHLKIPAFMELSIGRRSEDRRNRRYAIINKLYNLLEGDECRRRNLNRVQRWGLPARGVFRVGLPEKVQFAQRLKGKEGVSRADSQKEGISSTKTLRQLRGWRVKGRAKRTVWPARRNAIEDQRGNGTKCHKAFTLKVRKLGEGGGG